MEDSKSNLGDSTTSTAGYTYTPCYSGGNYGWICPRCGKVWAPWVQSCTCVADSGWHINPQPPYVFYDSTGGNINIPPTFTSE